jgi:peroxidase
MSDTFQNRIFPSLNDLNANAQVDMASINIQRGRDHGIPSYNKYREMCGFGLAKSFDDLNNTMWENTIALLKKSYADVNDIDLFVGGMAEATVDTWANFTLRQRSRSADASVGKTFRCLIEKQFELVKKSDRFWYDVKPDASVATDTTAFTLDQVNSIKDQSMSSLLCFNTNINKVRPRVFTAWGISHGSWKLFE